MTCQNKLYTNTDIAIPITLAGLTVADISDLSIKFVNRSTPATTMTYLSSTGGITISGSNITVNVSKTDITVAGIYDIYIKLTDTSSKVHGMTPCPGFVNFYQML